MDGLSPPERPLATLHPVTGGGALRLHVDQVPHAPGAQWLTEFLRREGIAEDRALPSTEVVEDEPAQKSYKGRVLIGIGALLAVGAIGAFAYQREVLKSYEHWVAPFVVAMNGSAAPHPAAPALRPAPAAPALQPAPAPALQPAPAAPTLNRLPLAPQPSSHPTPAPAAALTLPALMPIPPHQEMLRPLGDPAMGFANFPEQPADPPPTVMSSWAGALVIPTPLAGGPNGAAPATPSAAQAAPIAMAGTGTVTLPAGTPLYLRIVYTPSTPAEPQRFDALTKRLRSQVAGIAAVSVSVGPASYASIDYFFPGDRAGASRVAASLARMTKRAEPLVLLHTKPLPRPGTIEIRLTPRVAKELINEGY